MSRPRMNVLNISMIQLMHTLIKQEFDNCQTFEEHQVLQVPGPYHFIVANNDQW